MSNHRPDTLVMNMGHPSRTLESQGSSYVSMIVADVLAPSKHQAPITTILAMSCELCNLYCVMSIKNIFYGVRVSVTRQFLYYRWVSIFTLTLSHKTRIPQHLNTSTLHGKPIPGADSRYPGHSQRWPALCIPSATSEKAMMLQNLTGHKLSKKINFIDFANCDQTLFATSVNQVTKLECVVGRNKNESHMN